MALAGIGVLANALLAMPKTASKLDGVTNLVNKIGDYMDKLQAGPTGSPGIFALNRSAMIGILMSQSPVTDKSWAKKFATAWAAGVSGAVIAPGTVSDPAWVGSGVDVLTSPSAASTITTVAAGKTLLEAKLMSVVGTMQAPIPMATAVHDATKALEFLCIGLGPPPPLAPIPLTFTAQ